MPDYIKREFIEELDTEIKEFKKLQTRINQTLGRVRMYTDEKGAYNLSEVVDSMNTVVDNLEELKRSI